MKWSTCCFSSASTVLIVLLWLSWDALYLSIACAYLHTKSGAGWMCDFLLQLIMSIRQDCHIVCELQVADPDARYQYSCIFCITQGHDHLYSITMNSSGDSAQRNPVRLLPTYLTGYRTPLLLNQFWLHFWFHCTDFPRSLRAEYGLTPRAHAS